MPFWGCRSIENAQWVANPLSARSDLKNRIKDL
jgi:hypothetical protein